MQIKLSHLDELAPEKSVDLNQVKEPSYGRVLEDFEIGAVFVHPRGITVSEAFAIEFATTFMETNPLYLNREYAKEHGFKDLLVSPMMVLNLALSMGVQNDSEKAIANLGYYNLNKIILDNYLFFTSSFSYTELLLTNSGTISFILETNEFSFDSTIKLERSTR